MPKQKWPIQEFNGVKYYRKPGGHYKSDYRKHGGRYMHQVVWEFYNGAIPEGMCVHHKDHDSTNNVIENLALLTVAEHAQHHIRDRSERDSGWYLPGLAKAREAAAQWRKEFAQTLEGKEQLSKQGVASWENRDSLEYTCTHCGGRFLRFRGTNKRGYCSPSCQTAARVASGVDDETRRCAVCGNDFRVNRYAPTKTCSKDCKRTLISNNAKARIRSNRAECT